MNPKFQKNNLSLLRQFHPYITEKADDSSNFQLGKSKTGLPIPQIRDNQHWKSLHSTYKPEAEERTTKWEEGPLVVLGMGGFYHFQSQIPLNREIILIEPRTDFFRYMLCHWDMGIFFKRSGLRIILGDDTQSYKDYMDENYSPYIQGICQILIHNASQRYMGSTYVRWTSFLNQWKSNWDNELATQAGMGRHWFRNILMNLNVIKTEDPLYFSKNKALLLAAGPYLEDRLEELCTMRDDHCLFVVDSAFPLLRSLGIRPDAVFSMDAQWASSLHFYGDTMGDVPLIRDIGGPPMTTRLHKNTHPCLHPNPLLNRLKVQGFSVASYLGNVTAIGLDYLIALGFKNIQIWGGDFSFPKGKSYCKESYIHQYFSNNSSRLNNQEDRQYRFSCQAIKKDEHSYTTFKMDNYRKSMENYLRGRSDILQYEYSERTWYISLKEHSNKKMHQPFKWDSKRLKNFACNLEDLPLNELDSIEDLKSWKMDQLETLSTLFPICASYLSSMPPLKCMILAKDWAIKQWKELSNQE